MGIYIATCTILSPPSDKIRHAIAAARCDSPEAAEALVRQEVKRRGRQLAMPCIADTLESWRETNGRSNLVEGMARQLGQSVSFLMSPFHDDDTAAQGTLGVAQLEVPTVDAEPEAPFWDADWCSPAFHELVFGGDLKTYILVDCGVTQSLPGGFVPDALSERHTMKCLYTGDLMDTMQDGAPYLVDLTLHDDSPSAFQRSFASQIWGHEAAIVIRTDQTLDKLWAHLRKFTRIRSRSDAENWTYFRFWDPLVAATYFGGMTPEPTLGDRFCGMSGQASLTLVIEDGVDAATVVWPTNDPTPIPERQVVSFGETDHLLMAKAAQRAFRRELGNWLTTAHADRFQTFSKPQMRNLTRHIATEGERLGCRTKDDMVYLCHMMLSAGGWFHLTGALPRVDQILQNVASPKSEHLAEVFMDDCDAMAKSELIANWGDVQAHIKSLPEDEQLTPAQFRRLMNRFLLDRRDEADSLLGMAKADAPALELSQLETGKLLLLTLLLGYRFFTDPTLPWAGMSANQAIEAAWTSTLI